MSIKSNLTKKLLAYGLSTAAAISGGYLIAPREGNPTGKDGLSSVYLDPIGIPTVCCGQTGKDLYGRTIRLGMTYTQQECEKMLAQSVTKHEALLDSVVYVPYKSDWMKAALISFTYNVGIGNVKSSSLLKRLNARDYDAACNELVKWVYANKKKLPGLVSRRGEEKQWCLGIVPQDAQESYKATLENYIKESKE